MPHVLKTLLSIVEHQTDGQMDCGEMWPVERVELMVQIFEVCLNVLKSRNEPWITFVRSHIEVNRILTILTLIAEIPDIERLSAGRIRGETHIFFTMTLHCLIVLCSLSFYLFTIQ